MHSEIPVAATLQLETFLTVRIPEVRSSHPRRTIFKEVLRVASTSYYLLARGESDVGFFR
jgi:hypothetical protein